MGLITSLAKEKILGSTNAPRKLPMDREAPRNLWREIFSVAESKEDRMRPEDVPIPGGSWGRSSVSSDAAVIRLLQAYRSMAPGGWSDDRYEETRHYHSMPYVAIFRKSQMLGQAEFQVFRKDGSHPEGKRPVERGEPGWELVEILSKPNPQDSFGDLMKMWAIQKDLTGMALTWMVPNRLGVPYELYPVPTAVAIPQPAINPDYPDGYYRIQPVYPYGPFSSYPTPASAVGAAIPAQWMLRFKYPHPLLRYDGWSPLTGMRNHIDALEMMDRSRFYKMKRGSNPDAVLNPEGSDTAQPLPEPEINRIHAEWESEFQGPENHGKLIVGTPGFKFEPWSGPSPKEMDYTTSWDQLSSFVLGGFGITKPAAGMIEDATYATLFATLKQLHLITLQPECDDIASKLTRHLAPFFGDDLIIEIRCQKVDDHDVLLAKVETLARHRSITKGELRRMLDLPMWGDQRDDEIVGMEALQGQPGGGGPGMQGAQGEMQGAMGQALGGSEMLEPGGMPGNQPPGRQPQGALDMLLGEVQAGPDQRRGDEGKLERGRPRPGPLSTGALGRMKNLNGNGYHKKSMYEMVREIVANGHA